MRALSREMVSRMRAPSAAVNRALTVSPPHPTLWPGPMPRPAAALSQAVGRRPRRQAPDRPAAGRHRQPPHPDGGVLRGRQLWLIARQRVLVPHRHQARAGANVQCKGVSDRRELLDKGMHVRARGPHPRTMPLTRSNGLLCKRAIFFGPQHCVHCKYGAPEKERKESILEPHPNRPFVRGLRWCPACGLVIDRDENGGTPMHARSALRGRRLHVQRAHSSLFCIASQANRLRTAGSRSTATPSSRPWRRWSPGRP